MLFLFLAQTPALCAGPLSNFSFPPLSNKAVAAIFDRSQRAICAQDQKPFAVDYVAYVALPSFFWTSVVVVLGGVFSVLASFALGRRLLLHFPRLFTLGRFSHAGPTDAQMQSCSFSMTFFGVGVFFFGCFLHDTLKSFYFGISLKLARGVDGQKHYEAKCAVTGPEVCCNSICGTGIVCW
jgi:hypothetical protein